MSNGGLVRPVFLLKAMTIVIPIYKNDCARLMLGQSVADMLMAA